MPISRLFRARPLLLRLSIGALLLLGLASAADAKLRIGLSLIHI